MQSEDERAEAVAPYAGAGPVETKERRARTTRMTRPPACLLRSPGARPGYATESATAGEGGSGWPKGNGTWREGSLQADSPLAGARSRSDGCRGGQSVSRRPPDGVGNTPRPEIRRGLHGVRKCRFPA